MLEIATSRTERPADEMKRLIRQIAGRKEQGEKEVVLFERAVAKMNFRLSADDQIGPRRARSYWHAECIDVPSVHMDLARELGFVQPLEEAFDAVEAAELYLRNLRERLLDRLVGDPGSSGAEYRAGATRPGSAGATDGNQIGKTGSAVLDGGLTSSLRHLTAI